MAGIEMRTPWHLWLVGIVSLIWNSFGALDYTQTQLRNVDYIASMTEPMGIPLDAALAYYDSFPAWADAAWALGVWGAVLGSVLLLLRNRMALAAYIISFFGLVVTTLHGIANPIPGAGDQTMAYGFTAVLWIIAIALILYARAMVKRGFVSGKPA